MKDSAKDFVKDFVKNSMKNSVKESVRDSVKSGLVWRGLVWSDRIWSGLVWAGLGWPGLVLSGRSSLVWPGHKIHDEILHKINHKILRKIFDKTLHKIRHNIRHKILPQFLQNPFTKITQKPRRKIHRKIHHSILHEIFHQIIIHMIFSFTTSANPDKQHPWLMHCKSSILKNCAFTISSFRTQNSDGTAGRSSNYNRSVGQIFGTTRRSQIWPTLRFHQQLVEPQCWPDLRPPGGTKIGPLVLLVQQLALLV